MNLIDHTDHSQGA